MTDRIKIRVTDLKKRTKGRPLVAITVYDSTLSQIIDQCEVDIMLVGDSLGMVIQGEDTTIPVTLEDMVYHCRCVTRRAPFAHVVADMPFLSFHQSESEAFLSSKRLMQDGRAEGIKIECDGRDLDSIRRIEKLVRSGVPIMGHIGLRPQHVHVLGGYRKQGKSENARKQVRSDAKVLQEAGCYAILVECVPSALGAELTETLSIPVIGIGSGPDCDGQILVSYDLLGLTEKAPSFAPAYTNVRGQTVDAVTRYAHAVKNGTFASGQTKQ